MEIEKLRNKIDDLDGKILRLFEKRLDLVLKILEYKKENGIKIKDIKREEEILKKVKEIAYEKYYEYDVDLTLKILQISKKFQYDSLL